jgi:flavin-dependent dehydrogenase
MASVTTASTTADVVVVGGGPAGTAAAIVCRRAGLDVLILERDSFPRHRPGETLPPALEPLVAQLGAAERLSNAGFLRHTGQWVDWSDGKRFIAFGGDELAQWEGFQAPRAHFDLLLLEQACSLGCRASQRTKVLRPVLSGDRVIGVVTADGEIRSRFVVDAAGGRHWLAKKLGAGIRRYSPPLVARYGYAKGDCELQDGAPLLTAHPGGWTWIARVWDDTYQWTTLFWPEISVPETWRPPLLQSLIPIGRTHGADVSWRLTSLPAGPGFFVAGDAAAVIDPAGSHGVLRAVMSGMVVGQQIGELVRGGLSPADELERAAGYRSWLRDWFLRDASELRKRYSVLPDAPAWTHESNN